MKKLFTLLLFIMLSMAVISCNLTTSTLQPTTTSSTTTETTTVDTTENTESSTTTGDITTTTEDITTTTETTTTVDTTASSTVEDTTTVTYTTTEISTEYERYQTIKLYSMNDFHGGTYSDIANLEQIGSFLKYKKDSDPNTIILSNGDMFQGAALSNYYYGEPIVDVFNYIGFDGFVIGNHEFDWGIDKILNYTDQNTENGEMDYPILAANIVYHDTRQPLANTQPYLVKEVSGVRVGIIGVIGDVINSISASRVENIDFLDPVDTISNYAEILRTTEACDIVVVYVHSGSGINDSIAQLQGVHMVDAVFNGHTHQNEASTISRSGEMSLVYAQASNSSSSLFAEITLIYDTVNDTMINVSSATYGFYSIEYLTEPNIDTILNDYETDTVYVDFVTQELTTATAYFSRSVLAPWGASVIRDYAGVDIGALNSGGFRSSMESGLLTMGDMIEIYPFDNYIKTSELTGQQLLDFYEEVLYYSSDVVFDDQLTYDGTNLYINGVLVESQQLYTVGAVDYIFDKDYYSFLDGQNITQTTLLMRDLLVEDLLASNNSFNPANGTSYQELNIIYDPNFYRELKLSLVI